MYKPNRIQTILFVHIFYILTLIFCEEDCPDGKCKLVKPIDVFQNDCLKWHNYFRANHNAKPLVTSLELIDYAKSRVINMATKNERTLQPKDKEKEIGESVHIWSIYGRKSGEELPCRKVVQDYYNEIKNFDFGKEPDKKGLGISRPFSQMVWKSTNEVGCAQAYYKYVEESSVLPKTFSLCAYYKRGNIANQYLKNVERNKTDLTLNIKVAKAEKQVWEAEGEQDVFILYEDKQHTADPRDIEEIKGKRFVKKKIRLAGRIEKKKSAPRSVNDSKVAVDMYGPLECPPNQCTFVEQEKVQLDCLKAVNDNRVKHGVTPLVTSTKLMELARRRAIQVAKDNEDVEFPDHYSWGENAFALEQLDTAMEMPCRIAIKNFYDQRHNYDYNLGESTSKTNSTGHFTQLVWRSSQRMGCAQAFYTGKAMWKKTITICNFDPPGNIEREFLDNVYPPGGLKQEEIPS